jgi:hypothetical protein
MQGDFDSQKYLSTRWHWDFLLSSDSRASW